MGFGSYDESEQRDQAVDLGDADDADDDPHRHDHEGEMSFDLGAPTDDLVDRLSGFKDDADAE